MTDRDDVERLRQAQAETVNLAAEFLREQIAALDWSTPEQARANLLEIVPLWVQEFGDVAATIAAEWYEDTRPAVLGPYTAHTVAPASEEQIRGSLRALLGDVADADSAAAAIAGGVQRLTHYSGRETIARNVQLDPDEVRFARVPTGAKTCAWCEMLASRGFVYYTRETAGALMQFHDGDDCAIVASWEADQEHIAGYDPDAMYERYMAARQEIEREGNLAPTDKQIQHRMRDMFPEQYTNGRALPRILTHRDSGWPADEVAPVGLGRWRHILKRHAPGGEARDVFEGMTGYEIAKVIRAAAASPDVVLPHPRYSEIRNRYVEIDGVVYAVGTKLGGARPTVVTAFPPNDESPIMEAWRTWRRGK